MPAMRAIACLACYALALSERVAPLDVEIRLAGEKCSMGHVAYSRITIGSDRRCYECGTTKIKVTGFAALSP